MLERSAFKESLLGNLGWFRQKKICSNFWHLAKECNTVLRVLDFRLLLLLLHVSTSQIWESIHWLLFSKNKIITHATIFLLHFYGCLLMVFFPLKYVKLRIHVYNGWISSTSYGRLLHTREDPKIYNIFLRFWNMHL